MFTRVDAIEIGVLFVAVFLHTVNILGGLSYAFNSGVRQKMERWMGFTFAYYIAINNMLPSLSSLLNVLFGITTSDRWLQSVSMCLLLVSSSLLIKRAKGN